jgi:hypothetical protein
MPSSRAGTCVEIKQDAGFALRRHFDGRRREARRAHVLNADDRVRRHQFEARFDEQLFEEGIADLHGRALRFGIVVELSARHRRAVNAVAASFGADIHDRIVRAFGGGGEDLVLIARCRGRTR